MNIGHGFKKQEEPRKAFGAYKDNYSRKLFFGESSVSTRGVYRRRWTEKKSWLSPILILIIPVIIVVGILDAIYDALPVSILPLSGQELLLAIIFITFALALSRHYLLQRVKGKPQDQNVKMWIATLSFIYVITIAIKVVSIFGRMIE
jgi:putative copper export protein